MPISIQSMSLDEQSFQAEWNGQKFDVTYRPRAFTSKFQREYAAKRDGTKTDAEDAAWWISRVVSKWDVLGDDGKPLPLDEDWLSTQDLFDVQFLWEIIRQIQTDRRPKALTSVAPSVDGSSLV